VSLLLNHGADVHGLENLALCTAAAEGHWEVVDVLLAAGANPASGPENGLRPLRSASERGHLRVVRRLLAAGAPPDQDEDWPLIEAAGNGHAEIIRVLLKAVAHAGAANGMAL
jgi:ankyrin repeat protein